MSATIRNLNTETKEEDETRVRLTENDDIRHSLTHNDDQRENIHPPTQGIDIMTILPYGEPDQPRPVA